MATYTFGLLVSLLACVASSASDTILVGMYDPTSTSTLFTYTLDRQSGTLTKHHEAASPGGNTSWVAIHPNNRVAYAVHEDTWGRISSFSLLPGGELKYRSTVNSSGSGPVRLKLDAPGDYMYVANYFTGTYAAIGLHRGGDLGSTTFEHKDPGAGALAHEFMLDPSGRYAFAQDLGLDATFQWVVGRGGTLTPNTVPKVSYPKGTHPRHIKFHPHAPCAYLVNEGLGNAAAPGALTFLNYDASNGRLTISRRIPTIPSTIDPNGMYPAEVIFGRGYTRLYVSNRDANATLHRDSITTFKVGVDGDLTLFAYTPIKVRYPRSIALTADGRVMLAAGQKSNQVQTFNVTDTGLLMESAITVTPQSPAFLLPLAPDQ